MSDSKQRDTRTALLAALERYSIVTNPAPEALFSADFDEIAVLEALARGESTAGLRTAASLQGFSVWCTAAEHPAGPLWPAAAHADRGYPKPCSYLAVCTLVWDTAGTHLRALQLCTEAFGLLGAGLVTPRQSQNRPEDVEWATGKIAWLWERAFPEEPVPVAELVRLKHYE